MSRENQSQVFEVLKDHEIAELWRLGFAVVPRTATNSMTKAASAAMSPGRRENLLWVSNKEKHATRYETMINQWAKDEFEFL